MRSRIVAIDFGLKRIGVAISDESKIIATPFKTIFTEKKGIDTAKKLIDELKSLELSEDELKSISGGADIVNSQITDSVTQ